MGAHYDSGGCGRMKMADRSKGPGASMIDRRLLLGAFAVGGAAVAAFPAAGEDRPLVIDGCLFLAGADLTAADLAQIRASGLSAMNTSVGPVGNGPGPLYEQLISRIAWYERQIAAHPDVLSLVRRASDIAAAHRASRLGVIFGIQDTAPLGADLTRLQPLHDLGLRIVQLTYNRRNLVGDGCMEPNDGGLSLYGHEMVEALNQRRMLIDASHAGRRTVLDAAAASKAPIVVSHTGCADLVDRPRNTTDAGMRAVAGNGGVVGIFFMPFLREAGQPSGADLIRHIEHALNVCGEDHVAIGTDQIMAGEVVTPEFREQHRAFVANRRRQGIAAPGEDENVFNHVPDYNQPRRILMLADDLRRRGHSQRRIDKIIGGNLARVFAEVCG